MNDLKKHVEISGMIRVRTSPYIFSEEEIAKIRTKVDAIMDSHPLTGADGNISYFVNFPKEKESTLVRGGKEFPCCTSVYISVIGELEDNILGKTPTKLVELDKALANEGFYSAFDRFVCLCEGDKEEEAVVLGLGDKRN